MDLRAADVKRVLLFRIGSLGDTCVAIPAIKLVREKFPQAEIRVLTNYAHNGPQKIASVQAVIGDGGLVDGYFEYPSTGPLSWLGLWFEIVKWKADLLVYLMPVRTRFQLARDWLFFKSLGIGKFVGLLFSSAAQTNLKGKAALYEAEASRLVRNISALGTTDLSDPGNWDIVLTPRDINRAELALGTWPGKGNYVACSVGGKLDTQDWGEANWLEWTSGLTQKYSALGLIIVGAKDEFERAGRIARLWRGPILNLCGSLTPRGNAEILRRARVFIGHDSGPTHLAASVGTPCVSIFSARNKPGVWFPFGTQHKIIYHQTECYGCNLAVCVLEQKRCIASIGVSEVLAATIELLAESH